MDVTVPAVTHTAGSAEAINSHTGLEYSFFSKEHQKNNLGFRTLSIQGFQSREATLFVFTQGSDFSPELSRKVDHHGNDNLWSWGVWERVKWR